MAMELIRNGLCQCIGCFPKGTSPEDAEREMNLLNPSGITSPWKAYTERGDFRVQCLEDSDREHLLFVC